jgi:hypothetical protein
VWVEDSDSSALVGADLESDGDSWDWVSSSPTPFAGAEASQSISTSGEHQHYFTGSSDPLSIDTGDTLFAYVYLDPADPPTQVELQWDDGSWEHRAFWNNSGMDEIGFGDQDTDSLRYMGPLPATGTWVRLSVPASSVGLEGQTLNGMSFTLYGGKATWDHAGKSY